MIIDREHPVVILGRVVSYNLRHWGVEDHHRHWGVYRWQAHEARPTLMMMGTRDTRRLLLHPVLVFGWISAPFVVSICVRQTWALTVGALEFWKWGVASMRSAGDASPLTSWYDSHSERATRARTCDFPAVGPAVHPRLLHLLLLPPIPTMQTTTTVPAVACHDTKVYLDACPLQVTIAAVEGDGGSPRRAAATAAAQRSPRRSRFDDSPTKAAGPPPTGRLPGLSVLAPIPWAPQPMAEWWTVCSLRSSAAVHGDTSIDEDDEHRDASGSSSASTTTLFTRYLVSEPEGSSRPPSIDSRPTLSRLPSVAVNGVATCLVHAPASGGQSRAVDRTSIPLLNSDAIVSRTVTAHGCVAVGLSSGKVLWYPVEVPPAMSALPTAVGEEEDSSTTAASTPSPKAAIGWIDDPTPCCLSVTLPPIDSIAAMSQQQQRRHDGVSEHHLSASLATPTTTSTQLRRMANRPPGGGDPAHLPWWKLDTDYEALTAVRCLASFPVANGARSDQPTATGGVVTTLTVAGFEDGTVALVSPMLLHAVPFYRPSATRRDAAAVVALAVSAQPCHPTRVAALSEHVIYSMHRDGALRRHTLLLSDDELVTVGLGGSAASRIGIGQQSDQPVVRALTTTMLANLTTAAGRGAARGLSAPPSSSSEYPSSATHHAATPYRDHPLLSEPCFLLATWHPDSGCPMLHCLFHSDFVVPGDGDVRVVVVADSATVVPYGAEGSPPSAALQFPATDATHRLVAAFKEHQQQFHHGARRSIAPMRCHQASLAAGGALISLMLAAGKGAYTALVHPTPGRSSTSSWRNSPNRRQLVVAAPSSPVSGSVWTVASLQPTTSLLAARKGPDGVATEVFACALPHLTMVERLWVTTTHERAHAIRALLPPRRYAPSPLDGRRRETSPSRTSTAPGGGTSPSRDEVVEDVPRIGRLPSHAAAVSSFACLQAAQLLQDLTSVMQGLSVTAVPQPDPCKLTLAAAAPRSRAALAVTTRAAVDLLGGSQFRSSLRTAYDRWLRVAARAMNKRRIAWLRHRCDLVAMERQRTVRSSRFVAWCRFAQRRTWLRSRLDKLCLLRLGPRTALLRQYFLALQAHRRRRRKSFVTAILLRGNASGVRRIYFMNWIRFARGAHNRRSKERALRLLAGANASLSSAMLRRQCFTQWAKVGSMRRHASAREDMARAICGHSASAKVSWLRQRYVQKWRAWRLERKQAKLRATVAASIGSNLKSAVRRRAWSTWIERIAAGKAKLQQRRAKAAELAAKSGQAHARWRLTPWLKRAHLKVASALKGRQSAALARAIGTTPHGSLLLSFHTWRRFLSVIHDARRTPKALAMTLLQRSSSTSQLRYAFGQWSSFVRRAARRAAADGILRLFSKQSTDAWRRMVFKDWRHLVTRTRKRRQRQRAALLLSSFSSRKTLSIGVSKWRRWVERRKQRIVQLVAVQRMCEQNATLLRWRLLQRWRAVVIRHATRTISGLRINASRIDHEVLFVAEERQGSLDQLADVAEATRRSEESLLAAQRLQLTEGDELYLAEAKRDEMKSQCRVLELELQTARAESAKLRVLLGPRVVMHDAADRQLELLDGLLQDLESDLSTLAEIERDTLERRMEAQRRVSLANAHVSAVRPRVTIPGTTGKRHATPSTPRLETPAPTPRQDGANVAPPLHQVAAVAPVLSVMTTPAPAADRRSSSPSQWRPSVRQGVNTILSTDSSILTPRSVSATRRAPLPNFDHAAAVARAQSPASASLRRASLVRSQQAQDMFVQLRRWPADGTEHIREVIAGLPAADRLNSRIASPLHRRASPSPSAAGALRS